MPAAFVAGILHYRYETLHCQQHRLFDGVCTGMDELIEALTFQEDEK